MRNSFSFNLRGLEKLQKFKKISFKDIIVHQVRTLDEPEPNSIYFLKKISDKYLDKLDIVSESLIILPETAKQHNLEIVAESNMLLYSINPRLDYALVIQHIMSQGHVDRKYTAHENYVVIGQDVEIGNGTNIEPFVSIDHEANIGKHCTIKSGARIGPGVKIGDNSVIRENAVIGGQGFGIERTEDGRTFRIPHIGGVEIGCNVEIGALSTVVTGTIKPTIIDDFVKTDDHVHIAHNCFVGKGTLITACAELSGSITIGENSWIGPNASLMNGIVLGKRIMVGLGAVVTKSFGDDEVLIGNPAATIGEIKKIKKEHFKMTRYFKDRQ
jgi:UDP-3-O-[3-hydroxymyristoyl] glucosamine N-acyltransferase LpxD